MTEEAIVCGRVAEPSIMQCDGRPILVRRYRATGSWASDSLWWRFVTSEERVVVARPVQIPSSEELPTVPWRIESALLAVRPLIERTHGLLDNHEPDVPRSARGKRLQEIALYEINDFVRRTTGKRLVRLSEPAKDGRYTAKEWVDVTKRLTCAKDAGAKRLEKIRQYILNRLFREDHNAEMLEAMAQGADVYPPPRGGICDGHLRRLTNFMGDLLQVDDMARKVMLKYNRRASEWYGEWAREMSEAWGIKLKEGERHIAEHVTFIAECHFARHTRCYPVEDVAMGEIASQDDLAPYQIPVRKIREEGEQHKRKPSQATMPREGDGDEKAPASGMPIFVSAKIMAGRLGIGRTLFRQLEKEGIFKGYGTPRKKTYDVQESEASWRAYGEKRRNNALTK